MIFRTQKLQQLKNIQQQQSPNQINKKLTKHILNKVWVQEKYQDFHSTIESIGLKWMNQFVILIENWLTQSSTKYIDKLTQLTKLNNNQEDIYKIQQYLINLCKYISSMQHPLLTSINNIYSLYLKFPNDQLIQQPKKSFHNNQVFSPQPKILTKKKSLSIQSFTSQIPCKSRSTSKSRKLSFFNNSIKQQQNVFQTFIKQNKKNQNLNTTVKKVKKDLPFKKISSICTFKQGGSIEHNQKQNNKSRPSQVNDLKQKLEQRLSNTCSSTFFNQIILQKPIESKFSLTSNNFIKQSFNNTQDLISRRAFNQVKQAKQAQNNQTKELIQQELKKSIMQQIDKKQKCNYENLLKEIENKLSNKFDYILDKILRQKEQFNEINQIRYEKQIKKQPNLQINQQQQQQCSHNQIIKRQQNQIIAKQYSQTNTKDVSTKQIKNVKNNQINKQPSIVNNIFKQKDNIQNQIQQIQQIQQLKPKLIKRQNKINTSVIVPKDTSKIIKSKNKTSILKQNISIIQDNIKQNKQNKENIKQIKESQENKQIIKHNKQNKQSLIDKKLIQSKNKKNSQIPTTIKNQIYLNNSTDSIQIIDQYSNNNQSIQSYSQKSQINPQILISNPPLITQNKKNQSQTKKQDNFYTKRVKQIKSKMQNIFKNYKNSCQKLTLPVNQTFLLLFSKCYQQFCQYNSLSMTSQQVSNVLSKYNSNSDIKNKLPQNKQKFINDSLIKIQKMMNLKDPEKKIKIYDYTEKCIECIENIFFQKPDLKLNSQTQILKKIKQIKSRLNNSKNQ